MNQLLNKNLSNNSNNNLNNNSDEIQSVKKKKNKITTILVTIMSLIIIGSIIFLVVFLFLKYGKVENNKYIEVVSGKTKTIMIYMCGSDLESDAGLGTYNIQDLLDSDVDFENINIVLCVGGSTKWYNSDISVSETSIFNINEKGLNKVKKQTKVDMARADTITEFLDYAYENYQTDEYYLMFWNHGMALAGLEYDELSENLLSLSDLNKCFKNSKFNKDNKKLDMIILNNCLMGSLETANILSNYANYLVASEDVMLGSKYISTFKFLDGIDKNNDVIDIGKNYINCYTNSIEENFPNEYITFSLIDLKKIDNIIENLEDYFGNIKLDSETFKKIARIRGKLYEYQKAEDVYDMVDLYQLISRLEPINSDNENLLKAISEAVLYNSTTDPYSKGISMYFPETSDWTDVYDTIDFSKKYKKFVNEYIDICEGKSTIEFSLNTKEIQTIDKGFSLQLTEEEASIFKEGTFKVFEDNKDGTYTTVIGSSSDVNIDNNGLVTANIGKIVAVIDSSDGTEFPVGNLALIDKTDSYKLYGLPVILSDYNSNTSKVISALMKLKVWNDGKVEMLETRKWSKDKDGKILANGAIIDLEDTEYTKIQIVKNVRTIKIDENGNYEGLDDLKATYGYGWKIVDFLNDASFKVIELEDNKDYVGVFYITDVYNDSYYSKLIDIKK